MGTDAFALSNAILAGRPAEALNVLSVLKFEREKPEFILGEISRTFCDMLAVRAYLDAGRSTKEIATLLKLHEYKTGLLANAVRRLDPARLARAVELCIEADTALKRSFGDYAMIAMFVGMCATYIGSYVGKAAQADFLPLITALIAAVCMAVCEVLEQKYRMKSLENFDLALCMLIAMAGAVLISPVLG